ncbi:DUF2970 domain-containing protein [Xylophilus sp. GOD-11R]|uniref:DUF2970 domain-containing protein n=1 Tax=Xylophilus sp. GOD-11R TaxID=3089814 RepID=UPI00298C49AA|nr:DUF2970 domain-containing protein [Xylophilus sp. GOD-11R]WPB56602.1 DUF2970 domain-containing protein [Xylophilus sp. GOD-11R]
MSARRPGFLRSVRAVAWSFLGLRKASGLEEDAHLHPLLVLAVGFGAAVVLVLALMALVRWIV